MIKLRNARHNYILTDKCSQLKLATNERKTEKSLRCEHINVLHTHTCSHSSTQSIAINLMTMTMRGKLRFAVDSPVDCSYLLKR